MKVQTQSLEYLLTMAESEPGSGGVVAEVPGSTAAGVPISTSSAPGSEGGVAGDQREDLTVFFSIGMTANVIMVTVFLVWAIGQWRKTRK